MRRDTASFNYLFTADCVIDETMENDSEWPKWLDYVFGKDSVGKTAIERAQTSNRVWVRSKTQIALVTDANQEALGQRLSSVEALELFGIGKLEEAINYGAAVIIKKGE